MAVSGWSRKVGFPGLSGNKACGAGSPVRGLTVAGLLMVGCEKEGGGEG